MKRGAILGGRFRLGEQIARGGMGSVHRARDLSRDVDVAIKLLAGPRADATDRFSREAQVLASLDHPAIVRYVAHGRVEDGVPWLAMAWLEGEPLSTRLHRGPLALADAVRLVRRVSDAVGTAHAAGIVHRDIKPSNLFLVGGEPSAVVVLDFGIARRLHPDDDVTEPGAVVGTWSYMAPEQALARSDLDERADVFALGCVLFECLTGHRAFAAGQRTAVLAKILLEDPRAPSELARDVPAALDDLVATLLAKSAAERLRDGSAVAKALRELGDVALLPQRPRSSLPPTLGDAEKRILTVFVAKGFRDSDATVSETGTGPTEAPVRDALFGLVSTLHFLANGSLLGVVSGSGLPVDAALRAARAALGLARVAPEVSVAVATGFAVVSERHPVGVVIDRAVDLLRQTNPGDIRVDATTQELLAARCDLEAGEPGARLLGERDAIDVSRRLLGRATPFLGRDAELAAILATAAHALEQAEARIAVVRGAPGSGKSRLGVELVARMARERPDALVLFARGDSMGAGSPFLLVSRLLSRHAGIGTSDDAGERREKLRQRVAAVIGDAARQARVHTFLCELVGAPLEASAAPAVAAARADPRLMFDALSGAFRDWLGAELAARPVVVALDDLQWGDVPSVQLLRGAVERELNAPLFVLLMTRPDAPPALVDAWREHAPVEWTLGPLGTRATQQLVRSSLGPGVDADTLIRIVSLSQGNAFFAEELIRAAARGPLDTLPDTVIGTVQARLEALDSESRRVLRAASVFGERFSARAVRALLADELSDSVPALLDDLVQNEILLRVGGAAASGDELAFRHGLLRDAAYALLTDKDRALAHRLAAVQMESQADPEPLVVARHHLLGRRPELSVEWSLRGAAQALAGNDFEAALAACDDAEKAGPAGPTLGRVRLAQAQALRWLSRPEDSLKRAKEALVELKPSTEDWFDAQRHAGLAAANLRQPVDLRHILATLKSTEPETGAERARAIAFLHVATSGLEVIPHGDIRERIAELPELEALALADVRVRAWWHGGRALLAHRAGDPLAYLHETERAAVAHSALGDTRSTCLMTMNLGFGLIMVGELEAAEARLLEAREAAQSMGIPRTDAYAAHNLGFALLCAGRLEDARRLDVEAIEAAEKLGLAAVAGATRAYLALTLLGLGETEDAAREGEAGALQARGSGVEPLARAAWARAEIAAGRLAPALEIARSAVALLADETGEEEVLVRLVLAEALLANGDAEASEAVERAHSVLQAHAAGISDPKRRDGFIQRIPYHRETVALWSQLRGT